MAKGSDIMSNFPYTSDAVGGLCGAETIVGTTVETPPPTEAKKDAVKHAEAAIRIDSRIEKVLSPEYAPAYASAARTKNKPKFLDNTLCLLFGLADDDGIGGMVTSVADVERDFGGLPLLQRAMVRRLKERSSYMNRGWLSRLFTAEDRLDEFSQEEFKKFLEKIPRKNRKGDEQLQNKEQKAPAMPMEAPKPPMAVPAVPPAFLPPTATVSGMGRHHRSGADVMVSGRHHTGAEIYVAGVDPMVNAPVTGMADIIGDASLAVAGLDEMCNKPVTGAEIYIAGNDPMGNKALTGMADIIGASLMVGGMDPMVNKPVTGADIYLAGLDPMVNQPVTGADVMVSGDKAEAAAKIDERIAGLLKPYWSALYRICTLGNRMERKCAANSLMVAMLSDEGLAGMVKSMSEVTSQFENIGLMQRAMARRLKECCSWSGVPSHHTGGEPTRMVSKATSAYYRDIKDLGEYDRTLFNNLLNEDEARLDYLRKKFAADPRILARLRSSGAGATAGELDGLIRAFSDMGHHEKAKGWDRYPHIRLDPTIGSRVTQALVYGDSKKISNYANWVDWHLKNAFPLDGDFCEKLSKQGYLCKLEDNKLNVYKVGLMGSKLVRSYRRLGDYLKKSSGEDDQKFVDLALRLQTLRNRLNDASFWLKASGG